MNPGILTVMIAELNGTLSSDGPAVCLRAPNRSHARCAASEALSQGARFPRNVLPLRHALYRSMRNHMDLNGLGRDQRVMRDRRKANDDL